MLQWQELESLNGYSLQARDGDIGTITDVWFDDDRWTVRYLVVRTGGWLMGRDVLIAPTALLGTNPAREQIAVDLTREQVETSPPIDSAQTVSRHYETRLHHHYGWAPYWKGGGFAALGPTETSTPPPPGPRAPTDPHLRSSNEVRGYGLLAQDGEIGEVVDFVIDQDDWSIRYLVADTHKWLPGRKVLLAPAWVQAIRWLDQEVAINMPRASLRTAPQYQGPQAINKRFEVHLYQHYGVALKQAEAERT